MSLVALPYLLGPLSLPPSSPSTPSPLTPPSHPTPPHAALPRKSIADMIKTRTVVQVRTHAQKYFAKEKKRMQVQSDGGHSTSSSLYSLSHSAALSSSSSSSLSSNVSSDNESCTRKFKKNTKRGLPVGAVATGLAIVLPGRRYRSGSFGSTITITESVVTTPRLRKRNSHFFDDDCNDGADNVPHSSTPRRSFPRTGSYTPPTSVSSPPSAPAQAMDPVDLAFDADFRANIIASELNLGGLATDATEILVPADAADWLPVVDVDSCEDDTTVDNYSPVSSASSKEEEFHTFSIMLEENERAMFSQLEDFMSLSGL